MGREVRRVPANWQHPRVSVFALTQKGYKEIYLPIGPFEDLLTRVEEFKAKLRNCRTEDEQYALLSNEPPSGDYMPNWPSSVATHYMMYETCSEGTPISPAFATPEALARWLTDTGASMFGDMTASYEQWLTIAKGRERSVGLMVDSATGTHSPAMVSGD